MSRRPTTTISSVPERSSIPVTEDNDEADVYTSPATVESLNNQFYTNTPEIITTTTTPTPSSSPVASSQSTRTYGSVRRRPTTTTTTENPSTSVASETTTTTQTPHTQQTNSNPFSNIETNVADAATSASIIADGDQHTTSTVTNDQIDDNADEVTPTVSAAIDATQRDTSPLILTKSTAPTSTKTTTTSDNSLTPLSTLSSSVVEDDKKTDQASTIGDATTENDISTSPVTFKPFLGIVSSPRPFSFVKRTRPTFAPTPTTMSTTSTTPASIPSNVVETVTTLSHVKVSPNAVGARNFHSRFESNSFRNVNLQSLNQQQVSDGDDDNDDEDQSNDVVDHLINDSIADTTTNIGRRHSIPATVTSPYTSSLSPSLSSSSATTTSTDANANSAFAFKFLSSVVNRTNLVASHVHDEPESTPRLVSKLPDVAPTQRPTLESRQSSRPRPTSTAAVAPQSTTSDDNVRVVSYNIVRQRALPPILSATREEALEKNAANPRTNVNRQPNRGFRPNLADLLRETSNGLPGPRGLEYVRPETDLSSLTAIDTSRRRQQSDNVWTERLIPSDVTSELPSVSANGEISYRPQRTRPTRVSTTAEATVFAQRNVIRSRTSTVEPLPVPALVPATEIRESINIAADEIEQNKSVRFSLGRKIGLDASADNRLGPLQRKGVGGSVAKDRGDSPIIYIHPRLISAATTTIAPIVDTTTFSAQTEAPIPVESHENQTNNGVLISNSVIGVKNIIDGLVSSYGFGSNFVGADKSTLDLASTTEETKSPEETGSEKSVSTVQSINRGTRPPTSTSNEDAPSTSRRRRPPTIRRRPASSTESAQNVEDHANNTIRRRPVYAQRQSTTGAPESGEVVNAGRGATGYRGRVRARVGANTESLVGNEVPEQATEQAQTKSAAPSTSPEQNEQDSLESTTGAVTETEQSSSDEDTRRRPPYSARIIEEAPNSSAQIDSLFALRNRRPGYDRTANTTEEAIEAGENASRRFQSTASRRIRPTSTGEDGEKSIDSETDGKRVRVVTRRRRPVDGRTRTKASTPASSAENDGIQPTEANIEEENRQQIQVRRRPVYGRQRTSSSAAALIIKTIPEQTIETEANATSARVDASRRRQPFVVKQRPSTEASDAIAGEGQIDPSAVSRRRPVYGRTRTTTATPTENDEENSQRKIIGKTRTVVVRRRRPVSSTTTTETSIDELATTESNDEATAFKERQAEQATEIVPNAGAIEIVQTTTARLRPKYGRRRTTTETSAIEEENEKPIRRRPAFGRTRLRTSTEASVESEIRVEEGKLSGRGNRPAGERPAYGRRRTSTTTEETLVENAEVQQNYDEAVDALITTNASNGFEFGAEATTPDETEAVTVVTIPPTTTTKRTTYRRKIKKRIRTTTKTPEVAQENEGEEERVVVSVDESSQSSTTVKSLRKRIRKLRKFGHRNQTIAVDGSSADGLGGSDRDARTQLIGTFSQNQLNANSLNANDEVVDDNEKEDAEPAIRPHPFKPKYRPSRPSFSLTSTTESNEDVSRLKPFRPRFPRPSRPSFSLKSTNSVAPNADVGDEEESISSGSGIDLFHNSGEEIHVDGEHVEDGVDTPRIEIQSTNRFVPRAKAQPFRPKNFGQRPKFGKNRFTTTTSPNGVDNLDVNALANRNKQFFNIQSKNQNFLKSKQILTAPTESNLVDDLSLLTTTDASSGVTEVFSGDDGNVDDNESNTNTQSITGVDDDTTTTQPPNSYSEPDPEQDGDATSASTLAPDTQSINLIDILQGTTVRPIRKLPKYLTTTTTTAKPTTFHHVFAIDYDESTRSSGSDTKSNAIVENAAEVISKKVEKLAEVNRIVEVYSKQNKQTLKQHLSTKPDLSNLVIERLPTVNKLGEVSRITLIKLVDHQNESKTIVPDFFGFLTTTPSPNAIEAAAQHSTLQQEKKGRQIVFPESIFSVETSTIPLEGLFQTERNGKKLNIVYATTLDDATRQTNFANDRPSPVYVPSTTPSSPTVTPAAAQNDLKPVPLPINNDSSPLVISIANLDSVVLSKVTTSNNNNNNANNNNIDSDVESTTNGAADAPTTSSSPLSNDNNAASAINTASTTASVAIGANAQTNTPNGNGNDGAIAASSGKVSTIVDAPPHTTQVVVDDALDTTTVVAPSSADSSVVNTQASFSSEITKSKAKVSQLNELKQTLAPGEVVHDKVSQS